jgi:DHA1 family bicyclomycin/chloramphenicol resistance-like MFS transporter
MPPPDPAGSVSTTAEPRPVASRTLIALLIALTALAPVSLQIFLPALPAIQATFVSTTGVTQLVLSLSILANAVATLAYGPLSDRFGRRPVVLAGVVLFILGSLLSAIAGQIWVLIFARVVQSAGAAAGMVLARAIVRDLYDREQAASAISYLTMAMVAAPMIAPTIGALLIDQFGWRSIFVAMTLLGVVLAWLVRRQLIETRQGPASAVGFGGMITGGAQLLREGAFLAYLLQSSFSIATFFAFLAGAPYFMIDVLGRSATEYGLYFMSNAACFMVGNFISARIGWRVGIDRMIRIGSIAAFLGTLLAIALVAAGEWSPLRVFLPMMLVAFANGLSIANAQAGAVSIEPSLAGTASGLAGFGQMFTAAIVSQAVGVVQNGTPYPMVGFMAGCALLSLIAFLVFRPGR